VTHVFTDPFYGNNIIISHGINADSVKTRTQYKHLTTQIVEVGDTVARGQKIGTLGRTGILAGGLLHLHFEVQIEGRLGIMTPVNPNAYWVNGLNNITCFDPLADWPDEPFRITYPVGCR
jgi:murein DD-endopeptidase MepM/ murein hydrolase activator NlpD